MCNQYVTFELKVIPGVLRNRVLDVITIVDDKAVIQTNKKEINKSEQDVHLRIIANETEFNLDTEKDDIRDVYLTCLEGHTYLYQIIVE
jgi:hypothetical protein